MPRIYGYLVLGAVSFGYLLSNVFYYKAGRAYKKFMEAKEAGECNDPMDCTPLSLQVAR